ncbi:GntR family transcriptional regulator [Schaalia sp. ZJ405]|uniref:GntR family transcriptional regulator n=1 Tax=Schaalia sp. ZJ405 TaxID=2709403 RepID=UPI0013EA206E|nr:GntR family transcriptional regulator [Schaalia sp. ZJ405]QPK81956.1 GntR family transcriptional regulator [Schaalia sp. ZJ405]
MPVTALKAVALGQQLTDDLRLRIVQLEFAEETRLVEDTLAAEYGVSRGPVRDALKTLTFEGLLESRQRGYYVRSFSQKDVDELYEIRQAAETLAGQLVLNSPDPDWSEVLEYLEKMRVAAQAHDSDAFARSDLAFHTAFYEMSGNSRLASLWLQYKPTFATLLSITNAQDHDLHPSYTAHVNLYEYARDRRSKEFFAELSSHLHGSHQRLSAVVAHQEARLFEA